MFVDERAILSIPWWGIRRISAGWGLEPWEEVRRGREGKAVAVMDALWGYCGPCGGGRGYRYLKGVRGVMARGS